jgi:hypothetical protein
MNQQHFGMTVIPAMAGFFFFGKTAKVEEIQQDKPQQLPVVAKFESNGLTGVAKYLISIPVVTSVAKYLKRKDKHPVTRVEKYILKQAIADKNAPATTGVANYLAKISKEVSVCKKTSVDKYLAQQALAAKNSASTLTGVEKYEAGQALIAKRKAATAIIKKYKDEEEAAKEKAIDLEANPVVEKKSAVKQEKPAKTRVGRYLQEQTKVSKDKPKATGVAKYLAKKIIEDSQKPVLTGVSKYLRGHSVASEKKPNVTGVARYLSQHKITATVASPKIKLVQSGVARYIADQSAEKNNKPILSGVEKYLKSLSEKSDTLANTEQRLLIVEESIASLEGEFIPADRVDSITGVSRYLEKKDVVVSVITKPASTTGVSRYLDNQPVVAPKTGVGRYLLSRA